MPEDLLTTMLACVPCVLRALATLPATFAAGVTPPSTIPVSPSAASQPTATAMAPDTPTAAVGATQSAVPTTASQAGNGCPSPQAPSSAGARPDVVLGGQSSLAGGSASLATGQVLEVRLGSSLRWALTLQDPTHVLAPADGNGWFDASAQVCVWRFTAQTPGMVSLSYSGRPICPPAGACPQFIVESNFQVTVKG